MNMQVKLQNYPAWVKRLRDKGVPRRTITASSISYFLAKPVNKETFNIVMICPECFKSQRGTKWQE